jgi:hypothetical protein
MNRERGLFCPNRQCPQYGRPAGGNIVVVDYYGPSRRRLLKCRSCGLRFSERRLRFFFRLHTDERKVREVLRCLLQGMSFRQTARRLRMDKDTVHRIWRKFLAYCEDSMEGLIRDFNISLEEIARLLYQRGRKDLPQRHP